MHARLSLSMPQLEPPSFVCEQTVPGQVRLEYWSHRAGLAPMIVGLVEGLGELFALDVRVKQTAAKSDGGDHDEFLIDFEPARELTDAR